MFKWLFVDVDGVMTDGTKIYDADHKVVSKRFNDKDFTALALFKKKGVRVVLISGDKNVNEGMAKARGLEAYFTGWLTVDNEPETPEKVQIMKSLGADLRDSAYVGDDYFDIAIFKHVKYSYCPADSPQYVKMAASKALNTKGGEGVIADLFNFCYGSNFE